MSIYRSTNPLDFSAVDGIIIDESAPPASIQGVGSNTVIMLGAFERGPATLQQVSSVGDLQAEYGKNTSYSGYQALRNKKFSLLKLIRVVAASGSAVATKNFQHSSTTILTISALQGAGLYGNGITVAISTGSISGKKYVVTDTSPNAVLPQETYDNVAVASITPSTNPFVNSNLISVAVISSANEPDNCSATALASGADGTIADSDYVTAMGLAAVERAGNVLLCDYYSATVNAGLKAHSILTQDKMVIVCGPQSQAASAAATDAASYRDTDGRIIYAYPWVQTSLDSVNVMQLPASWYASVLSQTSPNIDPADADNVQFLLNANDLAYHLARADYISLAAAGVSAFEIDNDLGGVKIKSGVVTQLADSSKILVSRRRMADYLTNSAALFLKLYQNGPNSRKKRDAVKGAVLQFVKQLQAPGVEILPTDADIPAGSGHVTLVDTESLNTADSIAAGFFYFIWKQRTFSSMRYIVMMAQIGTGVLVVSSD